MPRVHPRAPRGIVSGAARFSLSRYVPAPALSSWVAHYWIVRWDRRGLTPLDQHIVPHPVLHLTTEYDRAEVVGIVRGRFTRTLRGAGRVLGIALRPAGFRALSARPVSELTGTTAPLTSVFGAAATQFHAAVNETDDDAQLVELAESLVSGHGASLPAEAALARDLVEHAAQEPSMTTVEALATRAGLGVRALQRLFRATVGVSPKWVILRYRLHEALARLDEGHPVDWAALALDLGYFDQAHFIKHFKSFVGMTPTEYARQAQASADPTETSD